MKEKTKTNRPSPAKRDEAKQLMPRLGGATKKEILKQVLTLSKRFYIHSQGEKERADFKKNNKFNLSGHGS